MVNIGLPVAPIRIDFFSAKDVVVSRDGPNRRRLTIVFLERLSAPLLFRAAWICIQGGSVGILAVLPPRSVVSSRDRAGQLGLGGVDTR